MNAVYKRRDLAVCQLFEYRTNGWVCVGKAVLLYVDFDFIHKAIAVDIFSTYSIFRQTSLPHSKQTFEEDDIRSEWVIVTKPFLPLSVSFSSLLLS